MKDSKGQTQYSIDCLAVTETWLSCSVPDDVVSLDGFNVERKDRAEGKGGGVLIYVRSKFRYTRIRSIECDDFEVMWISMRPHILPRPVNIIIVCILYCPPWYSADKKRELISYLIHSIDVLNKRYTNVLYLLSGDFNALDTSFLTRMYKFKQTVNRNTRGDKILDKIFISHAKFYDDALLVPPLGKSDHSCVLLKPISHYVSPSGFKLTYRRDINPLSLQTLRNELHNIQWQRMYNLHDCQSQADFLYTQFLSIFNHVMPVVQLRIKNNEKPWVTPYFKKVIAERTKAFNKGDVVLYKKLRNKAEHLRKHCKKQYYFNQVNSFKNSDPRKWWKEIKRISGLKNKNSPFDQLSSINGDVNQSSLSDLVNSFFISVSTDIEPLNENTLQLFRDQLDPSFVPDSFIVTEFETFQAMNRLKENKALGPDQIPNSVIKAMSDILCEPLCALINTSIRTGVIPVQWRISRITPIPKCIPARYIETDLRPIAITSSLSKIAESFANRFFNEHFSSLLDPDQYGNTKDRSTTLALIKLSHKLYTSSDKTNNILRILFVDFSKAFDRVNHNVLAEKFTQYNFDPHISSWFLSFLHSRSQYVVTDDRCSHVMSNNAGTPQGTITGPSNFKLLINDLKFNLFYLKYVDDLTIVSDSINPFDTAMQHAVNHLFSWSSNNKMLINVKKTQEQIITFNKSSSAIIPLLSTPEGHIQRCDSYKILGVFF